MRVLFSVVLGLALAGGLSAQRGGGGMRVGGGMRGGGGGGGFHGGSGGFTGGGFHGGSGGFTGGGFRGGGGFNGFRSGGFGGFRGYNGFGGYRGSYLGFGLGFGYGGWGYGGFGYGWPYYGSSYLGYGVPYLGGYYDGYGYDPYYDSGYGYGYAAAPAVTAVYPAQQSMAPVYVVPQPERANPVTHEYDQYGQELRGGGPAQAQPPAAGGRASSPIYLFAFSDHVIRAANAYWVDGKTLHYVTLQHEERQVPLDSLDRGLTLQLNRERQVRLQLP